MMKTLAWDIYINYLRGSKYILITFEEVNINYHMYSNYLAASIDVGGT